MSAEAKVGSFVIVCLLLLGVGHALGRGETARRERQSDAHGKGRAGATTTKGVSA